MFKRFTFTLIFSRVVSTKLECPANYQSIKLCHTRQQHHLQESLLYTDAITVIIIRYYLKEQNVNVPEIATTLDIGMIRSRMQT